MSIVPILPICISRSSQALGYRRRRDTRLPSSSLRGCLVAAPSPGGEVKASANAFTLFFLHFSHHPCTSRAWCRLHFITRLSRKVKRVYLNHASTLFYFCSFPVHPFCNDQIHHILRMSPRQPDPGSPSASHDAVPDQRTKVVKSRTKKSSLKYRNGLLKAEISTRSESMHM